jgi:uncharacterized protein involved in exopolysaccharide biosynthesis
MKDFTWSANEKVAGKENANFSTAYTQPPLPASNWQTYLLIGIIANATIWGAALLYTSKAKPSYNSELSITIPGAGSRTDINLPNIGQASSQNFSSYAGGSFDPRENYKAIATSEEVLKAAAKSANIPFTDFGAPRIKIVDNTTLMRFEMRGKTPKEAQRKTIALYEALENRLGHLREQEVQLQNKRLETSIEDSRRKLKFSQKRLSDYKAISGLSTNEQLSNLAINIETLRRQRSEFVAQQQQAQARQVQLSANLNLSPQQAGDAFTLQTDPIFQKYMRDYSEANSKLLALNAKFLPTHPSVITQKAEKDQAEAGLVSRAGLLLGRPATLASIQKLNMSNSDPSGAGRAVLSQQLVTANVDQEGLEAQVKGIDQQLAQLETRLQKLSQQQSKLDDLRRDVQIAEAVFSSTITRLDLSRSSFSASYPDMQILSPPTLPENKPAGKKNLVFFGAAAGSLFISSGIFTFWRLSGKKSLKKIEA